MRVPARNVANGFSLIELIVVIVILGVLAVGGGMLILRPIEAYDAVQRRQQLVDQGEMALRQLARDVRRALPNSLRVDGAGPALEMVNTVDGARYRDEPGGADFTGAQHVLDFESVDDEFNFLGTLAADTVVNWDGSGYRLVIYNTSDDIYAEAVDIPADDEGIITRDDIDLGLSLLNPPSDDDEHHITMSAAFRFTQRSPGQRAFIVDGPISYVCDTAGGRLLRYAGYGFVLNQPLAPADFNVAPGVVASRLTACSLTYSAGTAQRGGMLTARLTLADQGESISLLHQIHVDNLP